ncbi:hypothetical protein ACFQ08_46055, partial [Streptosporangium algeriense]
GTERERGGFPKAASVAGWEGGVMSRPVPGVALQGCDAVQQAHPGWLVFHSSQSGLWSAYRSVLPGRRQAGEVLLVRAESAEELDRKLTAQTPSMVPPSIRAVAVARALQSAQARQAARVSRLVQATRTVRTGQAIMLDRPTGLRRLLRS